MSLSEVSPGSSVSPGQILENLKGRIRDLEAQLAEASRQRSDHRRLQDLGPDELALLSVGAAGEIIKASRAQAAEVRASAEEYVTQNRSAAKVALDEATANSQQMRADARDNAAEIMATVRDQSVAMVHKAEQEADAVRLRAQQEADKLSEEASVQLGQAVQTGEKTLASANESGRKIVNAARQMADSLRDETQSETRAMLRDLLDLIEIQESAMGELLADSGILRDSISSVMEAVRESSEHMAAQAARTEARVRSHIGTTTQMRSDLQRRIGSGMHNELQVPQNTRKAVVNETSIASNTGS
ncbi:MAG: hypothetical protein OSA11_07490 [Candidatus Nanopelagicales bacterium]|nr:hypothetical protein [Candidatus Nanopelagicales bacterium]